MRRTVRRFGLMTALAVVAGMVGAPSTPASATGGIAGAGAGAVFFTASVHVNCFGCGSSTGTASTSSICVTGSANGDDFAGCGYPGRLRPKQVISNGAMTASYTVQEDPGLSCVITGSADGWTHGVLETSFHWLRVGAIAVFTTGGALTGAGTAVFAVTNPPLPSIPCGGPVDATTVGEVIGIW